MSRKAGDPGWELVFGEDEARLRLATTDTARFATDDLALGHVINEAYGGSALHKQALDAIAVSGVPEQKNRIEDLRSAMAEYRREESQKFNDELSRHLVRQLMDRAGPGMRSLFEEAWARIHEAIEDRALSQPKISKPAIYEVHHEIVVARECFFLGLIEEKSPADAEAYVRLRMSLDADPERLIREWRDAAPAAAPVKESTDAIAKVEELERFFAVMTDSPRNNGMKLARIRPPLAEKFNFWTDKDVSKVWKMDRATAEDLVARLRHNQPRLVGYDKAIAIIEQQNSPEVKPEPSCDGPGF